jgi:1-acyl-sn-glycerol-3-phosphate acyltransferase
VSGLVRRLGRIAFGLYLWAALVVVAAPVWLVVRLTRSAARRWRAVALGVRAFLRLAPLDLDVEGALPDHGPVLVACNHTSMLDGLLAAVVLPGPLVFVVAERFSTTPVLGEFLTRLGVLYVGAAPRGSAPPVDHPHTEEVAGALAAGGTVVVFPEGHLAGGEGLGAFHHGAFVAAARTGSIVVPVALVGTRGMLPPHHRLPRPGPLRVIIGGCLRSAGAGWDDAVDLADRTRQALTETLRADLRAGRDQPGRPGE